MSELPELDEVLAPGRGFMHLDDDQTAFASARVVIVPVPFDATTCYRPGTREGPQAIIDASRNLELYDTELRRKPCDVGIHTLRAIEPVMGNTAAMANRIELVTGQLLDRGKFVATLGGDHSMLHKPYGFADLKGAVETLLGRLEGTSPQMQREAMG